MQVSIYEKKFDFDFENFLLSDFFIDKEDGVHNLLKKMKENKLYTFNKPTLIIKKIKFDGLKSEKVSSFLFYSDCFENNENNNWEVIDKIEIENFLLLLNQNSFEDEYLDDWLESMSKIKLFQIEGDGKMCIESGFCDGKYQVEGCKLDNKVIALRIIFIKED